MCGKDIKAVKHSKDNLIVISQHGVEIRHEGRGVSSSTMASGYVYLVVDCSSSMAGDKLSQAKRGALSFAKDAVAKGYFVGLIRFNSYTEHVCEPTREIGPLDRGLEKLEAEGTTRMDKAIDLAHEMLKDKRGSRVMVVVTDGMPDDPEASLRAGRNAKKNSIDIITIGTDDADKVFLESLASRKELGIYIPREQLGQSIAASVKLLPAKTHNDTK